MENKIVDLPTKEDYLQWRSNHVTKALVRALLNKRTFLLEGIAEGHVSKEDLYEYIGRTQGIRDAIDYVISDFECIDTKPMETE